MFHLRLFFRISPKECSHEGDYEISFLTPVEKLSRHYGRSGELSEVCSLFITGTGFPDERLWLCTTRVYYSGLALYRCLLSRDLI